MLVNSSGAVAGLSDVSAPGECYVWAYSSGIEHDHSLVIATPDDVHAAIEAAGAGGAADPFPFPPAEDIGAAWGAGFVMVVGCYAIARAVGAVLNFIDRN
jgi:hypothetical protein